MGATAASGVIREATRIFVTADDVIALFGCGRSKAYNIVREVNQYAKQKCGYPMQSGKANKYLFSEMFFVPLEEIDRTIRERGQSSVIL